MMETSKHQMLFIAELNGYGKGTTDGKFRFGLSCYANRTLHSIDLNTDNGRAELHENIWLERLYNELDQVHDVRTSEERVLAIMVEEVSDSIQWTVPIEVDATSSMLQYMGALLGSKTLLTMTNCIVENAELDDAWGVVEDTPRLAVKTIMTPRLYGSSVNALELLQGESKLEGHDLSGYATKVMSSPAYGLADAFKEFILRHVVPKEEMQLHVWDEQFRVKCNHFRQIGEYTKYYKAYDTTEGKEKVFRNVHTKKVPDLKQFVRYFVTALIHNLDAQVANTVTDKVFEKYGWVIPIHDAFVIPPQAANDCKNWYAEELTKIYQDRKAILTNYFNSIGISRKASTEWANLMKRVDKVEDFVCSPYALK